MREKIRFAIEDAWPWVVVGLVFALGGGAIAAALYFDILGHILFYGVLAVGFGFVGFLLFGNLIQFLRGK